MELFTSCVSMVYSAFDSVWNWFLQMFASLDLDGSAIVFASIFVSAVLMIFVKPFLGQALTPQSDIVTRSVSRDQSGRVRETITRTRSERVRRR